MKGKSLLEDKINYISFTKKFILILLACFYSLVYQSLTVNVQLNINTTNKNAGKLSNITFELNRNKSNTGTNIISSPLTNQFLVEIDFSEYFDLSTASIASNTISMQNYTIDQRNSLISIRYVNVSNNNIISLAVLNVYNPLITGIYQSIYFRVKNLTSLNLVNQGQSSLTFSSKSFQLIDSWNKQFQPGIISTLSNFTIIFKPDVWKNGKMYLIIGINRYWTRSLQNSTSTNTIGSSARCEPTCTISLKGNFIQLQFDNVNILINNSLQIKIININSPPTLQKIDYISIQSYQKTYLSPVQSGSLLIYAQKPIILQNLIITNNNSIGQIIDLNIQLSTSTIFGPNDIINILFNEQLQVSNISISLSNQIVSSYSFQLVSRKQIFFSNFNILTSTYSKMSFNISIINGIKLQRSSKPVENNKITIKRNGYLYSQQYFNFSVLPIFNKLSSTISLSNQYANRNSIMNVTINKMTQPIRNLDIIKIKIHKIIQVYNHNAACLPIQCIGCLCNIDLASQTSTQSIITISNFPITGLNTFYLNISIKNPIPNNKTLIINVQHYDSFNYLIETFQGQFPLIKQSMLSSSTISFQSNNDFVYQISNYTLIVNLTNYDLIKGYMLVYFDKSLSLVNSSIFICKINDEPTCILKSNSLQNQIILQINVDASTKIYSIKINNIRNPKSTQPFKFTVSVYSSSLNQLTNQSIQTKYYQIISDYYQILNPFNVNNIQSSHSPCQNSKSSILTLNLSNLPFMPTNSILMDNPSAIISSLRRMTINQQILILNQIVNISIQNFISLQPIIYSFLIKTSDQLYSIFNFQIEVKNCKLSYLNISEWKISGLLGQQGYLNFVLNDYKIFDYMKIQLPIQYSNQTVIKSNSIIPVQAISLRIFKLKFNHISPLIIQIWNFTNLNRNSSHFKISTFKTGLDNIDYIISQNSNTINYDQSKITICIFPCKICSLINNKSVCLECYTSQFTIYNLLLQNGTCSNQCQIGYYKAQQLCKKCPNSCLKCDQNKCSICQTNYYFLNGSCLTDCPQKYYPITINQTCQKCIYPCQKCLNSTICLTCAISFYLNSMGNCVSNCNSNQLAINGQCKKCLSPCIMCNQALSNCTQCSQGYYLNENKCVDYCPSPLVPAISNNICVSCSLPCLTCVNSPTICTSCQYPYKLNNFKCLTKCQIGYFQQSQICINCPSQCLSCSSLDNCSVCATQFKLYNQKCQYFCPLKYFEKKIISSNIIYNNTFVCSPCGQNCIKCINQLQCVLCVQKYFLINNVCQPSCPLTMYQDINVCKNCSKSCLYCVNSDICQVCSLKTYLYGTECIDSCPDKTIKQKITVNVSYPISNNSLVQTSTCVNCSQKYSQCQICTSNNCIQCKQNFVLDYDLKCKVKCQLQNYINLNNLGFCVKCQSQCAKCQNKLNNCTSCSLGYFININYTLNLRQCVKSCSVPMIVYQNQCVNCSYSCKQCTGLPDYCTSCQKTNQFNQTLILYNSTCITECPQSSYQLENSCVQCHKSCKICSKQGCLLCSSGYFTSQPFVSPINNKTLYYCYNTCPDNLPFIKNNTICTKCSQNCISCNSIRCLECVQNYYIYGQYCTKQCPLPLVIYSKSCVNKSDIPTNNTITETKQSYFSMPIPFTLGLLVTSTVCIFSKLQYSMTFLSISIYSIGSMICILGNIYYLINFLIDSVEISCILLIISLVINYILNIMFIILNKFTLLKDFEFNKFYITHKELNLIFGIGFITTNTNYVLLFSRLFNFSIFKAHLQNLYNLRVINYLWVAEILVFILSTVAGVIRLIYLKQEFDTQSEFLKKLYWGLDLFIINFVMFFFSLLNLKKTKEIYLKEQDIYSTQSTKKVIFGEQSNQNIQQYDSRQQMFDTKAKNFKIINQDLYDGLLPQSSGSKFTQQQENHNYDQIFAANQFQEQKIKTENFQQTYFSSFKSKIPQQKVEKNYQLTRTIDIQIKNENQSNKVIFQSQKEEIIPQNQQESQKSIQNVGPQVENQLIHKIYYDQNENNELNIQNSQKQISNILNQQLSKVSQKYQLQEQQNNIFDMKRIQFDKQKQLQTLNNFTESIDQKTRLQISLQKNNIDFNKNKNLKRNNIKNTVNSKYMLSPNNKNQKNKQKQQYKSLTSLKTNKNQIKKNQNNSISKSKFINRSLSENKINKNIQIKNLSNSLTPKKIVNSSKQKIISQKQIKKPYNKVQRYYINQKIKKRQQIKKQDKQFFIPSYLFSSKNYKSKNFQQARISGIKQLFRNSIYQSSVEKDINLHNFKAIKKDGQRQNFKAIKQDDQIQQNVHQQFFQHQKIEEKSQNQKEQLQNQKIRLKLQQNVDQMQIDKFQVENELEPQDQQQFKLQTGPIYNQLLKNHQQMKSNQQIESSQSQTQSQKNKRFYLYEKPNQLNKTKPNNLSIQKIRKSKSFSPSNFLKKQKQRTKIRYDKSLQKSQNKTLSQKDYRIVIQNKNIHKQINKQIKNKNIISPEKKLNNKSLLKIQKNEKNILSKKQMFKTINQIQRKQKLRAEAKKISKIYGNTVLNNKKKTNSFNI